MKSTLAANWRLLTLSCSGAEMRSFGKEHLKLGLVWTWLVGMGRWWDDPGAFLLQHLGLGSLIYILALSLLLWLVMMPLRPRGWSYLNVLAFVSMTAPPAILYAIPVERYTDLSTARSLNVGFLAVVALWRVLLLFFFLSRSAQLSGAAIISGALLPISAIVTTLTIFNLERAVFNVMAGLAPEGGPHPHHPCLSLNLPTVARDVSLELLSQTSNTVVGSLCSRRKSKKFRAWG